MNELFNNNIIIIILYMFKYYTFLIPSSEFL